MKLIDYNKILDIFIDNLIPETTIAVEKGNKIFGAFIIKKSDLSLLVTGINNEIINPLYHGEISAIFNFFKSRDLKPKDYYFISSHEPCSLCLSAITWSGFTNFYYFFPYLDTKNKFSIPHDLNIMNEVFKIKKGKYNSNNLYWKSFSIIKEINKISKKNNEILNIKINQIYEKYEKLSNLYQKNKNKNDILLN